MKLLKQCPTGIFAEKGSKDRSSSECSLHKTERRTFSNNNSSARLHVVFTCINYRPEGRIAQTAYLLAAVFIHQHVTTFWIFIHIQIYRSFTLCYNTRDVVFGPVPSHWLMVLLLTHITASILNACQQISSLLITCLRYQHAIIFHISLYLLHRPRSVFFRMYIRSLSI